MNDTQSKGEIAKLKVELRANEKGFVVSRTSEGSRYDLVIDDGHKLYRVQVKYANGKESHSTGCVQVCLRKFESDDANISPKYKKRRTRTYTSKEIDVLATYLPEVDKVCWFPVKLVEGKSALTIRYEPPKNNQSKNLWLVEDYEW